MNKIYRIYTENVGRRQVAELVSKYFKGFTILDATGYYKGQAERSMVIELMASDHQSHVIRFLSKVIAQKHNQECVLVTEAPVKGEFVNGL